MPMFFLLKKHLFVSVNNRITIGTTKPILYIAMVELATVRLLQKYVRQTWFDCTSPVLLLKNSPETNNAITFPQVLWLGSESNSSLESFIFHFVRDSLRTSFCAKAPFQCLHVQATRAGLDCMLLFSKREPSWEGHSDRDSQKLDSHMKVEKWFT